MVHSPVKTTATATAHKASAPRVPLKEAAPHKDAVWIARGLDHLLAQKGSNEWISPMTKTVHSKVSKAATVGTFNVHDLEEARAATIKENAADARTLSASHRSDTSVDLEQLRKENARLSEALEKETREKAAQIDQLKKELAVAERQGEIEMLKYKDATHTKFRENYRLKEDLRIMTERATEFRDARDKGDKMIKTMKRAMQMESEQSHRLLESQQLVNTQLIAGFNEQCKELRKERVIKQALTRKCMELQDESTSLKEQLESLEAANRAMAQQLAQQCLHTASTSQMDELDRSFDFGTPKAKLFGNLNL